MPDEVIYIKEKNGVVASHKKHPEQSRATSSSSRNRANVHTNAHLKETPCTYKDKGCCNAGYGGLEAEVRYR